MAVQGIGYFDGRGQYFKTPEDATISDLAALLGRIGDGESLAPGIAKTLLLKRREVEQIFQDHDRMLEAGGGAKAPPRTRVIDAASNVARLPGT